MAQKRPIDVRNSNPSPDHHREFMTGWKTAEDNDPLTDDTLKDLTWHNAGWRLGWIFGPASRAVKEAAWEWCVMQQSTGRDQ